MSNKSLAPIVLVASWIAGVAATAPAGARRETSGRGDGSPLTVTTDRLSYRMTQNSGGYGVHMIATLSNTSTDTVFLVRRCATLPLPSRQFQPLDAAALFFPPGGHEACAASAGASAGPRNYFRAIAPDESWRDTIRAGAIPFIRRGETAAREGIARYRLDYIRFVRRGFLRKRWTVDPKVHTPSDPFELITPGFDR